ncbi:hypothetical protein LY90DRAFT_644786 [Neocallimastix californiae]|uniref:CBM10 domain-containing protein n=1 Tax=Neocallimastix californiae TaxID=1754190 RepID=A0A1Y2DDG2_9FUNG|nr:hypothetical protein LY90DRAFT_644786 [Neocallimastix californiae]|eukprot:ORY57323.1 hypothetical protein LY90DRAFT_644786 [Neocallimastix californiae]
MRANIAITTIVSASLAFISMVSAEPDPNFHIYLAFGQSNMEGQAKIEDQDLVNIPGDRFKILATPRMNRCNGRVMGEWYDAVPPLASCAGKLGPVDYFGRTMVENLPQNIRVGAAIVAVAGCSIQLFEKDRYQDYEVPDWMQGRVDYFDGNPYARLVEMGKKAQEVGVIKGILLHQGESNEGEEDWPERVKAIYDDLLLQLNLKAEDVPLLAGEVVQTEEGGMCGSHNEIIAKLPEVIPTAHIISSRGLDHQGDNLHFSSESYRILGQRYAETINTTMIEEATTIPVPESSTSETTTTTTTTTNTTIANENENECWAEALGYPCCTGRKEVLLVDDDSDTDECYEVLAIDYNGQWSTENGHWCGITNENTIC